MSNTGNDRQKGSQEGPGGLFEGFEMGDTDCSPAPGNLDTNWQSLGNISSVVLRRLMKSQRERGGVTPAGSYHSTRGEQTGSDLNRVGHRTVGIAQRSAMSGRACGPNTDDTAGYEDRTAIVGTDGLVLRIDL